MTDFFLGVDGGQSSTLALIGDATGRVVGAGAGGPCNHVEGPEGRTKFVRAAGESIGDACRQAGIDLTAVEFASACLGFSGGPEDKQALVETMLRARRLTVTNDALIALMGATAGAPGIICIAGTGSIAFGRNGSGRTARAGGWGYVFGDEGGGFDLCRQALRAMLRAEEGWGPPTLLTDLMLAKTGAAGANELMHLFYTTDYPRPRIASYAALVDEAARRGDAEARNILIEAAGHLAVITGAVREQLFAPGEHTAITYIGGVFRSPILLEAYGRQLESHPANRVAPPIYPPAAGALLEAYRTAGLRVQLSNLPETGK